mgnify:FL=1
MPRHVRLEGVDEMLLQLEKWKALSTTLISEVRGVASVERELTCLSRVLCVDFLSYGKVDAKVSDLA